ncbi:SagB family peptide dehydrogenase [Amycolatopsis sp. H20-H5]|uniref:SagB family peptide dehydrogenase n=1 Tax=Amycolatopsis sp. H20-H5 TaxID=3046309 RepID=UPI002DB7DEFD|nr:SagB family peptide dehydrogenase [Amycolatopsis sp. H20-H5]MEC3975184.1 SagB family peptide dehydrogenase [Amycolatopsis sp. H20-H5]
MTVESGDGAVESVPLWSLTEDTLVEVGPDGLVLVITRLGEFEIDDADAVVLESLRRMALGPVSLRNVIPSGSPRRGRGLTAGWADADFPDFASLRRVLDKLSGSVVHSLGLNDGKTPVLSVMPVGFAPPFAPRAVPPGARIRLSRFATMRSAAGGLMLESPCTRFQALLSRRHGIRVASSLAVPMSIAEMASEGEIAPAVVADIVAYLVAAGLVLVGDPLGRFAEDFDPELRQWAPHELLFHVFSRTRPLTVPAETPAGQPGSEPAPVVKPVPAGLRVPLFRPDLADAATTDPTLTRLLETDHECPVFSEREISAEKLGELLFRSARIRSVGPAHLPAGTDHQASQRPYFNIAGIYELELYVAANRCAGLPRAIYHYDPAGHALTMVNDDADDLATMLDMAMVAGGGHRRPPALVTVTVRMERIAWALGGAAYATVLLHLGALQQTLYLAAKAMGLAAHAVPVDASDQVDRALKLRWPAEVGVGECVLDVIQ